MKYFSKIVIAYFPILLTFFQLLINLIYFINKDFYVDYSFYFSNMFGQSLIFSLFLVLYTYFFKFCSILRITAITQLIICILYLIIQNDNIYNILFQIIVAVLSLLMTVYYYVKKYPKCRISLYIKAKKYSLYLWNIFLKALTNTGFDCEKGLREYKLNRENFYKNG